MKLQLVSILPPLLLAAACLSCGPEGPDTATTKDSEKGLFRVSFTSEMEPPPVHEIHRWRIHLETAAGEVVEGAWIRVDGGMPEHQHGLPTQPQVTEDLGGGDYLVEGMKFSMGGYWVLDLAITADGESDKVRFERVLVE